MRHIVKEIVTMLRYAGVGIVNTAVTAALMTVLSLSGLNYRAYTFIAYIAGILVSYFLNLRFTFRTGNEGIPRTMLLFILVSLTLTGLVQILQLLLIEYFGFQVRAGVVFGMIFYTSVGYTLNRLLVFRRKNDPQRKGA